MLIQMASILISIFVLMRYGVGERYGGYVVKKRGNVWTVHHTPSFFLFYHSYSSFLRMRERSYSLLAADLPDGVTVCEESIWLDGARDGASQVRRRKASLLDYVLSKQLYVQNIYNWIPRKRIKKRIRRMEIMINCWTADDFRSRFVPSKRRILMGDQGVAGSLMYFMLFTYPMGLTLLMFAMQISNNAGFYDVLYTAADAATLAGAEQQVTTVIQYQNGYPALWTQTINDDSATVQSENLFRLNLFAGLPADFIDQHMYFNGSSQPGYIDSAVASNLTFPTYNYNGQTYQVGATVDIPVAYDTTLINAAMNFLKGGNWSNQVQFVIHSRSSYTFLLYDPTHSNGYKP